MKADKCWTDYAVELRRRMFQAGVFELEVCIEEVKQESRTDSLLSDLKRPRFWNSGRDAKRNCGSLFDNGIEMDFDVDDDGSVRFMRFRLDERRRGTLERALLRQGRPLPGG